ncbi:unnamed protein product [Diatraea saccharalis]|uniref:ATP-dependent DNA helicase n=1 Tax=Diatraea saccharalis TaxID=40085 RepID=A0A9N9RF34_9NEOP|nr:unnamed protein product [Diatraea saccharalis]
MSHKRVVEALNRSLQDIRSNETLMGGAAVVLTGDFRQTLPVIEKSTPADEMNACLKASSFWSYVEKLHLTRNIRAQPYNDTESGAFASKLLDIGDDVVDGASRVYTSIDTVMASDDSTAYSVEFLNSLELTCVPPHKLELKVKVTGECVRLLPRVNQLPTRMQACDLAVKRFIGEARDGAVTVPLGGFTSCTIKKLLSQGLPRFLTLSAPVVSDHHQPALDPVLPMTPLKG